MARRREEVPRPRVDLVGEHHLTGRRRHARRRVSRRRRAAERRAEGTRRERRQARAQQAAEAAQIKQDARRDEPVSREAEPGRDEAFFEALRGPGEPPDVVVFDDDADPDTREGGAEPSRRQRRRQRRSDKRAARTRRRGAKQRAADTDASAESADAGGSARPETSVIAPAEVLQRRRPRRRSLARRLTLAAILLVLAGATVAYAVVHYGAAELFDRARDLVTPSTETDAPAETSDDPQPSLVIATYRDGTGNGELLGLTALAYERASGEGTVLLVPLSTVVDVPGYGSFRFDEAWRFGGPSLVGLTLDNMLGVRFDGVIAVSEQDWQDWLAITDGADVDVRGRIVARDGPYAGQARFEAGRQYLDPSRLAEYLTVRGEGETELDALPRTQQVVMALLDAASDRDVRDDVAAHGATLPTTAQPDRLPEVLRGLAEARTQDAVSVVTLPVSPLGSPQDDLYRFDRQPAEALVLDRLEASRPHGDGVGHTVQVLNGNGQPGIGRRVTEILVDGGYRTVLTGNADRFDHPTTRILVYGDTAEDLRAARDIRDRLGVGVVERSGTPQSVVDVTIVVGLDFPPD